FLLCFQYCVFVLVLLFYFLFFFFSSRRRHTRSKRDWSSDVCSSDLNVFPIEQYLSTFHRHEKHLSNKNFWHQEYGLPFYIKVPLLLDSVVRNENQSEPPSAPEELASLL